MEESSVEPNKLILFATGRPNIYTYFYTLFVFLIMFCMLTESMQEKMRSSMLKYSEILKDQYSTIWTLLGSTGTSVMKF